MILKQNNKFKLQETVILKQNLLKRCVIENSCDSLDLSTIVKYRVTDFKNVVVEDVNIVIKLIVSIHSHFKTYKCCTLTKRQQKSRMI